MTLMLARRLRWSHRHLLRLTWSASTPHFRWRPDHSTSNGRSLLNDTTLGPEICDILSVWICLRLKAPGYLSNHYSADWWDWCLMSQMNRAGTQRQSAHFIRRFHRRLLSCNHNTRVPCGRKIWHSTLSTFHNWWARWLHTATELRMHHPVYLQVTRQEVLDTGEVIRFHILWICAQVEITPSLLISVRMYWHSWTNETKGAQGG
jgi:hypothetical protein